MTNRVLILEAAGNLWGSERVLLDMLRYIDGLDVAVCCPPGKPLIPELQKLRVRVFPSFIERLHEKSRCARLIALLRFMRTALIYRPSLLYLNQAGCYRIASLAGRLLRIPIVAHVRIFEDIGYLDSRRPSAASLVAIIGVSAAITRRMRECRRLRGLRLHTIYDGYVPRANTCPGDIKSCEYDVNQIACIGRVDPSKGQDVLLRAIGSLKERNVAVRCIMVGTGGDFCNKMKVDVNRLGLQDRIRWTGFMNEPRDVLRACRTLVCPSHREPLGRVIFEAWDAGCLPIAFAESGGAAEVIAASQGGLLYSEQTPGALADTIEQALRMNAVERAARIENGRAWLANNCDPRRYAEAMRDVFLTAIRN